MLRTKMHRILDLHDHPPEGGRVFLDLLQALRDRRPDEKLYVVCDNFSPHRHPTVTTWAANNKAELMSGLGNDRGAGLAGTTGDKDKHTTLSRLTPVTDTK